jgi:methionyl aminopeptidase
VNEEAVHGIPSNRILCEGDLVKLDVTIEKDGFMADAAETVAVGSVDEIKQKLMASARNAFEKSLRAAKAGNRVMEIGRIVERVVRRDGFFVIRELEGHGIGRTIHEPPSVPNFADPRARQILTDGMVLTVEPIIAAGVPDVLLEKDGWTIRTADRSPSAHYEHTMVITPGKPILLTA